MSLLAFEDVACLRGTRLLFEGLSLAIGPGEALIVSGPNGVGKSTLLRIAAGLLRPSAGHVRRDGKIAWLGEATALDEEKTPDRALGFWARLDRRKDQVTPAMTTMGIADLAGVPVRFLSTGQRRRAAIARTMMTGADVWLLDEPANGLDSDGIGRLGTAIAAHRADGGAVLLATHLPLPVDGAASLALASP